MRRPRTKGRGTSQLPGRPRTGTEAYRARVGRVERGARNETLFREANERIAELSTTQGSEVMVVLYECAPATPASRRSSRH